MREFFIVRHGETVATVEGRHQCRIDTPLTQNGKRQMIVAGKKIKKLQSGFKGYARNISVIYSSPMQRNLDSLKFLVIHAKFKQNTPIYISDDLLEHNMGAFDGMTQQEVESVAPGFTEYRATDKWNIVPPNGENYHMVQKRVNRFIKTLGDGTFLILGHKACNKILISSLAGIPRDNIDKIDMPCGCVYYIKNELYRIA